MGFNKYIFLFLLLLVLLGPLVFTFNKQYRFYKNLKYLFPTVIFAGAIFVIWSIRFTELGIFTFNPDFLSGFELLKLPLEEWLLFFMFSYGGLAAYEWCKIRFSAIEKPNLFLSVSLAVLLVSGLLAYFSRQKLFTFFTFFLLTVYFAYTIFRNRFKPHYTKFYLAYFIALVPFLIVKGILIKLPAIGYDSAHVTGARLINIPVELFAYLFLLLLINVTIYEYLKERRLF